jgi:hypothetical protein
MGQVSAARLPGESKGQALDGVAQWRWAPDIVLAGAIRLDRRTWSAEKTPLAACSFNLSEAIS